MGCFVCLWFVFLIIFWCVLLLFVVVFYTRGVGFFLCCFISHSENSRSVFRRNQSYLLQLPTGQRATFTCRVPYECDFCRVPVFFITDTNLGLCPAAGISRQTVFAAPRQRAKRC